MIDKLRWFWRRGRLRGKLDQMANCALAYTPEWGETATELFRHETEGIRRGWITDRDRIVRVEN